MSQNLLDNINLEHIKVDERTGAAGGRLPLVRLVGNNRMGPSFDVEFVHSSAGDGWKLAMPCIKGHNTEFDIYLADGSVFKVKGQHASMASHVVDIKRLGATIYHRDGTVETFKEVGLEPYGVDGEEMDFKFVSTVGKDYRERYSKPDMFIVGHTFYVLDTITTALGHQLKFNWRIWHENRRKMALGRSNKDFYRLLSIEDAYGTLLSFDEDSCHQPKILKIFPGSARDEFSYNLTYEAAAKDVADTANKDALEIHRYGDDKKTVTKLKPSDFMARLKSIGSAANGMLFTRNIAYETDGRLKSISVQLSQDPEADKPVSSSETITWSGQQVKSCLRSNGVGLKDETVTYDIATKDKAVTTTVTISGRRDIKMVKSFNEDGRQIKESITAGGKTRIIEQSTTYSAEGCVGTTTEYIEGAADSEKDVVTWHLDRGGNLIYLAQKDLVTKYTYADTLHFIKQSIETRFKDEAYLRRAHSLFFPVWGIFNVLAAEREEKRTLYQVGSGFSVDNKLLGLPLPINYPGERQLFDRYVQSEVTYRRNSDGKPGKAIRARWYSYGSMAPKEQVGESITDGKVPMLEYVITVLEPELKMADSSALKRASLLALAGEQAQREIAFYQDGHSEMSGWLRKYKPEEWHEMLVGWASPEDFIHSTHEDLDKVLAQKVKRNIETIDEQSNRNQHVLVLSKSTKSAITVEKTSYSTDADSYGLPAQIEFYHLDADHKEISNSKVTTKISYAYVKEVGSFATLTEVKAADGSNTASHKTVSALTGSGISQGTDYMTTFSRPALDKEKSTTVQYMGVERFKPRPEPYDTSEIPQFHIEHKYENDKYHRDEISGNRLETRRTTFDLMGRQIATTLIKVKSYPLSSTTYDDCGRLASYTLYDYVWGGGPNVLLLSKTYSIIWSYDANGTTITRKLCDRTGEEIDSAVEVLSSEEEGLSTITRGGGQFNRQVDEAKHTVSEWQGDGKSFPYLKTVTTRDAQGAVSEIKYLSVTAKDQSTELLSRAISRDDMGRTTKVSQAGSADIQYTYDVFGRVTSVESAGVKVSNVYPVSTAAQVAISASISEAGKTVELGTQKHDGFGRVTEETPTGVAATSFSYVKGSRWGRVPGSDPVKKLPTMKSFSAVLDPSGMFYKETCHGKATESVYSTQGRLEKFSDIANNICFMTYDVYGRIKSTSTSSKAETSYEYRADGLLLKETIKDLVSKKTMTITFTYDLMGYETSRTFECTGFSKLVIERTLLNDGRLKKSTVKVNGTERRSDSYSYQECGRLGEWSCTGEDAPCNHENKKYTRQKFTYDTLGDVVKRENETSSGPSVSTYTFSSTVPGMLTKSGNDTQENDAVGRLTKRANRSVTYWDNGLVKTYSSEASAGSAVYEFHYDDFGCLRDMTLGTDYKETYHYRGNKVYARRQTQTSGNSRLGYHDRTIILLNDSTSCYLQQVITVKDLKGQALTTTTFELRDAAGSIIASYDLSKGTVTYFSYSAYGYRNPQPSSPTWLGFKGEPLNALSLYHLGRGYRLYDPQLHRFQTPDSWSPFGRAGANEYCFCCSDPVNNHDPSGHMVEVWSEKRAVAPILDIDMATFLTTVINVASIALAPFSGGASLGLRVASTVFAIGVAGMSTVSLQIGKTNPVLSLAIDAILLATGRFGGGRISALSRNARWVGTKAAAKAVARAEKRGYQLLAQMDDALDMGGLGLIFNGAVSHVSGLVADSVEDSHVLRAQWNSPFMARPDAAGRQHLLSDDAYLSMAHVDQFLKQSPPLRDAIAEAWGKSGTIDVVKVMKDYLKNAGTLGMENQSPLSPQHKVLHDISMYGMIHNDSDGMYCRGNSVSVVTDQLENGFVPFEQRPDLAL